MRVTAVIPTKNRPDDLVIAVGSILDQTQPPFELVIIDQSADARGRALVEKLFAEKQPSVELNHVLDTSITGLVPARAAAVRVARGEIVMFFEDDVVLEPDFIARMLAAFAANPKMMGATGVIVNFKPGRAYSFFHKFFHRGIFHDPRLDWHGTEEKSAMLVPSTFLNGGLSAYRREVFERVKFDCVNGFHMVEDIEFSVRAAETFGTDRFFIVPGARLVHNAAPGGRHALKAKYMRKTKEYILFFKKRQRSLKALASLGWLLVGMCLESALAVGKFRSVEPFVGMWKGLAAGVGQPIAQWQGEK